MILPYWVSVALLLLALALMSWGFAIKGRGVKASQILSACGMFVLIIGMAVASLRSIGNTRERIEAAVTDLSMFAKTDDQRFEAKQAAEQGLSDLGEDIALLIAAAVLLGVSGTQLIQTLGRKSAANPQSPGTSA